jgi:putative GTP pyrophosphokinase
LRELIIARSDLHVIAVKDYFTAPKESGYKSIHLIAEYCVDTCNGAETILCEIQLRTLAMDYWATIEHSLNYKYKSEIPQPIAKQLQAVAHSIEEIDRTLGKIREEIVDAQKLFQRKTDLMNQIIDRLNVLSRLGEKNRVKKYYKDFSEMRDADNTVQLSLLNKELENEIQKISKK